MSDFESLSSSEEALEKALRWLNGARLELEKAAGSTFLEPDVDRFLTQLERGAGISGPRAELLANLLDRSEEFSRENEMDIMLEQFYTLKLALDKS